MEKSSAAAPKKASHPRPTVMAVYCPLWHRYDHMDSWKGYGWNEWELVKAATPRFPGHYQPLKPTWGCFDESDPKWAAKEIDLAADSGIDVFMFDWYWYSGVKIMEETLEGAFLKAPNRKRMKFALMWAPHHWADYFPAPPKPQPEWNQWLPIRFSARDFERMIDYCADHYFGEPNYWKVADGLLFYSIFDADSFVAGMGGPEKTRRELRKADRRMNARGLPSIHWNGMTNAGGRTAEFKAAGFHSATSYNVLNAGTSRKEDKGIQTYPELMKEHHRNWTAFDQGPLPHFPVVTMGWDVTPRCLKEVPFPYIKHQEYPYTHVVVGNTPKRFGQLCRDAVEHLAQANKGLDVVMINAWNEWTEGCYLLPEKRYGDAYLRAIRDVFGLAKPKRKSRKT